MAGSVPTLICVRDIPLAGRLMVARVSALLVLVVLVRLLPLDLCLPIIVGDFWPVLLGASSIFAARPIVCIFMLGGVLGPVKAEDALSVAIDCAYQQVAAPVCSAAAAVKQAASHRSECC